jgi:hypothetical protein
MNPHIIIQEMKIAFEKWNLLPPHVITVSHKTYDLFLMSPDSYGRFKDNGSFSDSLSFDGVKIVKAKE